MSQVIPATVDPNEDTEWNDILRAKGIIPQKPEPDVTDEQIAELIEQKIHERDTAEGRLQNLDLDQLDEVEDDEDEEIIRMFREKRIAEVRAQMQLNKFGEVEEISAVDYVDKVNKAGEGIYVFLHLYKQGIPLCTLINQYLTQLAVKFPQAKFLKSISTTCIPNFPDKNLPTIFVYFEGNMIKQYIGAAEFGNERLKVDELEWMLSRSGGIKTDLEEDPRGPRIKDVMMSSLRRGEDSDNSDEDW